MLVRQEGRETRLVHATGSSQFAADDLTSERNDVVGRVERDSHKQLLAVVIAVDGESTHELQLCGEMGGRKDTEWMYLKHLSFSPLLSLSRR